MTRLIGLGGDCQVAHQIERVDLHREHHFFDSVVTPLEPLITLLTNNFDRLLQPEWLEPEWRDAKLHKISDQWYDIWHMHEIGQFEAEDVARLQAKYAYLREKFLTMWDDGAPVMFIRRWHIADGAPSEDAARRLLTVLQSRKPTAKLLYLHDKNDWPAVVDGAYRSAYLLQTPDNWRGDDNAWSDILRRVLA